jgi:hypothetical protein
MKIILLIAALALPAAAQAQVYKCQDGGRTVYSQDPWPKDTSDIHMQRGFDDLVSRYSFFSL